MFRNRLPASVEMLGNNVRRHRLDGDQRNDRPPRRISYGLENVSFHYEQEYATKRLHMSSATERFRKSFFFFFQELKKGGVRSLNPISYCRFEGINVYVFQSFELD